MSEHLEAELISIASRAGHLRFSYNPKRGAAPNVVVQASRESVLLNVTNTVHRHPGNVTYPLGHVTIDKARREVYGWNDEQQE